ncbi:3-hydroxyacyl-CoA dehydrogenase family protein [Chloroflexota bacterium]
MKKIGVVGCGVMANGIVIVCAQANYQVVFTEMTDELVKKGLATIDKFLSNSVKKEKITEQDKMAVMSRIKGSTDINMFADCDMVIEAVSELIELKKQIFADLDRICKPEAIIATNTSCLSIIDLASMTKRPEKVLGLHFMNPVPIMKLIEVVRTLATSDETLDIGKQFSTSVGKTVVIAKDTPGFIANYLIMPYLLNAMRIFDNGVATKEDIDTTMHLGFNHPMGPLTLSDLIGLDTVLFVVNAIYDETKDPQFAAPSILSKMVTAGWHGRKTGKGFYDYS